MNVVVVLLLVLVLVLVLVHVLVVAAVVVVAVAVAVAVVHCAKPWCRPSSKEGKLNSCCHISCIMMLMHS